jgi:hypothetical protein
VNHVTQIHDFNPGYGDPVNDQGDRTFWTVALPDKDVQVTNLLDGKAEMHVQDLAISDYFEIPNSFANGPAAGALVSFDMVWNGPVTRSFSVNDAAQGFSGSFFETQATMSFSASNELGFGFDGQPGDFSTTPTGRAYAELGRERNGIFFPAPSPPPATSRGPLAPETIAFAQGVDASAAPLSQVQVQIQIAPPPEARLGQHAEKEILISAHAARKNFATTRSLTPSLPASSTTALDQVFAEAAAKLPEQDFSSAVLVS